MSKRKQFKTRVTTSSLLSLEQDLESYYAQPAAPDEVALGAALGMAAREIASMGSPRRP
ncbi:MAG TPA: hypothetical protein VN874_01650 [Myxococcales bacterium]|nr:hypothetical protein [Myxococcales bacterium]